MITMASKVSVSRRGMEEVRLRQEIRLGGPWEGGGVIGIGLSGKYYHRPVFFFTIFLICERTMLRFFQANNISPKHYLAEEGDTRCIALKSKVF